MAFSFLIKHIYVFFKAQWSKDLGGVTLEIGALFVFIFLPDLEGSCTISTEILSLANACNLVYRSECIFMFLIQCLKKNISMYDTNNFVNFLFDYSYFLLRKSSRKIISVYIGQNQANLYYHLPPKHNINIQHAQKPQNNRYDIKA